MSLNLVVRGSYDMEVQWPALRLNRLNSRLTTSARVSAGDSIWVENIELEVFKLNHSLSSRDDVVAPITTVICDVAGGMVDWKKAKLLEYGFEEAT